MRNFLGSRIYTINYLTLHILKIEKSGRNIKVFVNEIKFDNNNKWIDSKKFEIILPKNLQVSKIAQTIEKKNIKVRVGFLLDLT